MKPQNFAPLAAAALFLAGCQSGQGPANAFSATGMSLLADQTNRALDMTPLKERFAWHDPESKADVVLVPTRTYQLANGTYCREYSETVNIGGKQQTTGNAACRQSDGSWQAVN